MAYLWSPDPKRLYRYLAADRCFNRLLEVSYVLGVGSVQAVGRRHNRLTAISEQLVVILKAIFSSWTFWRLCTFTVKQLAADVFHFIFFNKLIGKWNMRINLRAFLRVKRWDHLILRIILPILIDLKAVLPAF